MRHAVDIDVDRIKDVDWNKKAFENLVVDEDTKHLVQALISIQVKAEKSTDLISGKGNGLIMLLHGYVYRCRPISRVADELGTGGRERAKHSRQVSRPPPEQAAVYEHID